MTRPQEKLILAYITTKDKKEAEILGRQLVEKRVAACVNIIDGMESHYWWEGKIESSREAILIAKTVDNRRTDLLNAVKAGHSYSVPCVLFIPVDGGNPDYCRWLLESISS